MWALAVCALLAGVWFVYQPGLSGGFLFDDYANLPSLGATGPIDNGAALARYLTSGTADPTGRPIAVASFLLDAQNWPALSEPFLYTNLLLHLLNVALLLWLQLALGRAAGCREAHAQRGALLGAALWGLHPLLVSTTLYIVQREAMLPATFILAGLLVWMAGRRRVMAGAIASGVLLEWLGLGLGTVLATLSKADGALMPFYALLLEWLVLRRQDTRPPRAAHRVTMLLLAVLPAVIILGYLAKLAVHGIGAPEPFGRDFTVGQRLLTEPRILWDYIKLLWLPRPFTPGLFNDQIHASTSLLHPVTTLPALAGVAALLAGAWALRKRAPLWALAILFYFAGQLLESTSIPLELYFEHRNYVPALLMFWPLALWLTKTPAPAGAVESSNRQRNVTAAARGLVAAVIVVALAGMTHARAEVWGNRTEQALLWARLNPESPRAQAYAAQILTPQGYPQWALQHLRPLLKQDPGQIQIAFNLVGADCALGVVPPQDIAATRRAIVSTRRLGSLSFKWIGGAINIARAGTCRGLTPAVVKSFIDAAWHNPQTAHSQGWQQDILNLRGRYALAFGTPLQAYQAFAAALLAQPEPASALQQAAMLGRAGHQHLALCELALLDNTSAVAPSGFSMRRVHAWVLTRQDYWRHEIRHLRAALQRDLPADQRGLSCPRANPSDSG